MSENDHSAFRHATEKPEKQADREGLARKASGLFEPRHRYRPPNELTFSGCTLNIASLLTWFTQDFVDPVAEVHRGVVHIYSTIDIIKR